MECIVEFTARGVQSSVIKHEPKANALSWLETATPSAVNSTMQHHVHINCCIVTLNIAEHYHGNIDDAFDLFLNFARCMDDSRAHVHYHAILSLYCTHVHYKHYMARSRDQPCCTCCNASAFSLICLRKSQYYLILPLSYYHCPIYIFVAMVLRSMCQPSNSVCTLKIMPVIE